MAEIIFVIQKIVLRLMFPVGLCLILGFFGLLFRRRRFFSTCLIILSFILLLLLSTPYVSLHMLKIIEDKAGSYANPQELVKRGVKYIVVLSGDYRMGRLTSGDHLGCSVIRLIEGARLFKAVPESKLVLTGGAIPGLSGDEVIAEQMKLVALDLGVPETAIIHEDKSWTTEDQARACKKIVGDHRFALVTSAYHLPRSMMMFRHAGLDPIPAPCDFLTKEIRADYSSLTPQAGGLMVSQIVFKETIAHQYYALKALFQ